MQSEHRGGICGKIALLALPFTLAACSSPSSCSRDEEDVTIEFESEMLSEGVYYSAPYGGPYQFFPGGRTLHFQHGLGKVPLPPTFWLAFAPDGQGTDNPVAPAAGNSAELVGLDEREIAVKNDTCTEFHIWFYAIAQP